MPQRKLGCSARRAVALSADGAVLTACWGSDPCPTAFSLEDGETRLAADEVAGADGHLLALADGRVFSWGQGQHGALGLGSHDDRATPTLVGGLLSGRRMTAVSCGAFFSMALDAMGRVFWWGDGKALRPQEVGGELVGRRVVALSHGACANHAGAVDEDGALFTWGMGWEGQLGHGRAGELFVVAPVRVRGDLLGKRVVSVSGGLQHSLAVAVGADLNREAGLVFAWGAGTDGQLGPCFPPLCVAPPLEPLTKSCAPQRLLGSLAHLHVRAVSAGDASSACLTADGRLFAWGRGWGGREPVEVDVARPAGGGVEEGLVVEEVACHVDRMVLSARAPGGHRRVFSLWTRSEEKGKAEAAATAADMLKSVVEGKPVLEEVEALREKEEHAPAARPRFRSESLLVKHSRERREASEVVRNRLLAASAWRGSARDNPQRLAADRELAELFTAHLGEREQSSLAATAVASATGPRRTPASRCATRQQAGEIAALRKQVRREVASLALEARREMRGLASVLNSGRLALKQRRRQDLSVEDRSARTRLAPAVAAVDRLHDRQRRGWSAAPLVMQNDSAFCSAVGSGGVRVAGSAGLARGQDECVRPDVYDGGMWLLRGGGRRASTKARYICENGIGLPSDSYWETLESL